MRLLILADLHGNMPALEAILAAPEACSCDRIYSLGDHTGFGPQPREAHRRLASLGAVMLLGNHDERLSCLHEAKYQSRNWALLHWMGRQMQGVDMNLPREAHIGGIFMTHAVPGNVDKLIFPDDVPALLGALPDTVLLYLSGHNHTAWDVCCNGRRAVNPGSAGMQECAERCTAPFLVVDTDTLAVSRYTVPYDINAVREAYLASGCTDAAPIFTRLAYHTIERGISYPLAFMPHAKQLAASTGRAMADDSLWLDADRTFDWPDPVPSDVFWKELARR